MNMIFARWTIFLLYISLWSFSSAKRRTPFSLDQGTPDAMFWFNYNDHGAWPIQQAPIYGVQYGDDYYRRFLTVRLRDEPIVQYSNKWVKSNASTGDWKIRCPSKMLLLGMACTAGDCSYTDVSCGKVAGGFAVSPKKRAIVAYQTPGKTLKCPDAMYAQGLECKGIGCLQFGLYCVLLSMSTSIQRMVSVSAVDNKWYPSNIFSENENSWVMSGPVHAIQCFGDSIFCERKQLHTTVRGDERMTSETVRWTGPANAAGTFVRCPRSTLVTGMYCMPPWCGSIHIGCAPFVNQEKYRIDERRMKYSNTFSMLWPHRDVGTCPDGYYANGIECVRDMCSVMMIRCVSVEMRE